jgi:hypothetical protein
MFGDVIAKLIASDTGAEVWAQLAQFGDDNAPAIFTQELPEDCPLPAIVIQELPGSDDGCRTLRGGEAKLEIQVFGDKGLGRGDFRQLARDIWDLVDRADLSEYLNELGFDDLGCSAAFPSAFNDENGFPAYRIPLTMRVLEKS